MTDRSENTDIGIDHGNVHYPLGGGAYIFKNGIVSYLNEQYKKNDLKISIGAQPNSTPHIGTLSVFSLAFSFGNEFLERYKPNTSVLFEIVDTAPSETVIIDGITYQKSLRNTQKSDKHLISFYDLLDSLSEISGVPYECRKQSEFNSSESIPGIVTKILKNRNSIAKILDPEKNMLRIRISCPDCGLADKKGIDNRFTDTTIDSHCPDHGWFETDVKTESHLLEYNTPLRNLVRAMLYREDNNNSEIPFEWLRITGNDYAGYYQEQLLFRCSSLLGCPASEIPQIIYSPLITDWSGAKISKSLAIKGAYKDIPEYMYDFEKFKETFGSDATSMLFEETTDWVRNPFKLFRDYSVYYFMDRFKSFL
jgi:hypothetical protein